jgi:hypothetical protein
MASFYDIPKFGVVVFVHGHSNDLKPILIFALQVDEAGNFRATRPAPGGPEIQKNHLSFVGLEANIFAIDVFHLNIGGWIRVLHEANHRELCSCAQRKQTGRKGHQETQHQAAFQGFEEWTVANHSNHIRRT